ncbi:hypothetical protein [Asaia sp. As-1742]|uniref:hypothetical protein n=1 Tax=Asaia sp. As-1742 TaxID=2608325 RepID=UPI001422171A|nr:hypothetical protein [Asaia sp. As-1742]NIE81454.1 hypothetical protein [Asaia sp. As-1742]
MKTKRSLSNREWVWIRQQFGRAVPEGLRLEAGFPLPVRNGSTRREAYVPEALTSLLVRGLAEIRPGADAMGRYFSRFRVWPICVGRLTNHTDWIAIGVPICLPPLSKGNLTGS